MSVVVNVITSSEVMDPMDPNVRSMTDLTPQQERVVKILLGIGVALLASLSLLGIFKESINSWLSPKTFYDSRKRMRTVNQVTVQRWFDWIVDFTRAVIAFCQDYLPRDAMFKKDPVSGHLTGEPSPLGYWLERIDRAIDKVMGVARTFILARFERAKQFRLLEVPRRN